MEGRDGWVLHRAFWNAGQRISGFFIDKYLASKNSNSTGCVSVKNGDPLVLYDNPTYNPTNQLPDCDGCLYDAIVLGRKRGARYCCASLFSYSAIAMLSLAHSQACGDGNTEYCAWNDENPWCKGNSWVLEDYYDSSVTYTASTTNDTGKGLTGSGTPFAKTTHNGQNCGVADISGSLREVTLGVTQPSGADSRFGKLLVLKTSADICTIESYQTNIYDANLYDEVDYTRNLNSACNNAWPNTVAQFSSDASGADWALTGCYPRRNGEATSSTINYLMKGNYDYYGAARNYSHYCPSVGGIYNTANYVGLLTRGRYDWPYGNSNYGFRCMAVPTA